MIEENRTYLVDFKENDESFNYLGDVVKVIKYEKPFVKLSLISIRLHTEHDGVQDFPRDGELIINESQINSLQLMDNI